MNELPTNSPIVLPEQKDQKKRFLKGLFFLEISLFEIGFVVILLVLIFGTLNYFNIIKLSSSTPSLSFIPHQQQPTATPTPTPIPIATNVINNLLKSYISNTLQLDYLPKDINSLIMKNTPSFGFQLQWVIPQKGINIRVNAAYNSNQTKLDKMTTTITTTYPFDLISSSSAQSIVQPYFKQQLSSTKWICASIVGKEKTITCENFNSTNNLKTGFGLINHNVSHDGMIIFSCSVSPENIHFSQTTTCLADPQ